MYITCEQCSTIYRLDERRLKPSGSKVRCSECRYVFVAEPPEPVLADAVSGAAVALADQPVRQQDRFDQELEGIDLAELDSILEQGRTSQAATALVDQDDRAEADELVELDEADLDLDFEIALEPEEDAAPESDAADQAPDLEVKDLDEDLDLDLDLDMDFDLDVGDDVPVQPPAAEEGSLEADLDMEFELDEDIDESAVAQAPVEDIVTEGGDLTEDVELALDDFEDALGQPEDMDEASLAPDAVHEEEPEPGPAIDEASQAPGAGVQGAAAEAAAEPAGDDLGGLDLGDLDALLDEEGTDAADELDLEDVELSLADDAAEAVGEPADLVAETGRETETASTQGAGDDLDLSGFEDMLDETDEDLAASDEEPGDVELSLDDDFELSLDEEPATEPAAAVPTDDLEQAGDDLDLAGLDDLLAEDDETADEAPAEELDLSLDEDLELSLDEEAPALDLETDVTAAEPADETGDDLDLAGFDDLLAEEDETAGEAPAEDLELSLDDDLELSLDEEATAPALEGAGGDARVAVDRNEFDLSDLEDLLGEDAAPAGEDDVIDLSGLDEDMEAPAPEKAGAEEDLELELDDGISFSLDEEPSLDLPADAPAETPAEEDQDDFDLSGFGDDLLDGDLDDSKDDSKGGSQETPADDLELTLDDDLELSLDDITETEAVADTGAEDDLGELEDLDFEIDAEFEDKPISQTGEALEAGDMKPADAPADTEDEEIDLSDIEKMLEDDTMVPEPAAATTDFELDLDADGAEKWVDEGGEDLGLGGGDEIDLTELEQAIDSADTEAKGAAAIDDGGDLDLDLDLEPESADEPEELVLEMEDESPLEMELALEEEDAAQDDEESDDLDLSDFDLSIEEKPTGETETIDAGDIQLEFQVDDHGSTGLEGDETIEASAATAASAETTDFFMDEEDFTAEETITTKPIQAKPKIKAAPAPKKKGGGAKMLVFVLILALLGAGGYYGYDYVIKNNIVIPYLSDYINPEAKDPKGITNLSTMDINSMFIDNEAAGRLFVVKGKVRNGYTDTRKMIRLKGELFTKGKVPVKTEYVYAGLVVPEQELSSKPIAEIKKRLVSTSGQAAAVTAGAGQNLPFMVVFDKLPADLDEFEIELISSAKAQ